MVTRNGQIEEAAERLLARPERSRLPRPSGPDRRHDIDLAYQVQQRVIAAPARRRRPVVGRKIGLTSDAVQRQVGVDQPDFGVLLDDMRYEDGEPIPVAGCCSRGPRRSSPSCSARDSTTPADRDPVRAAVAYACPAIEIVDSRVRDWHIGITDTVADNASSPASS